MAVIPAGRFRMGSPADEPERDDAEGPQRDVHIAAPFAMGVYAVIFEDYERFCVDTKLGKPEDQGWGSDGSAWEGGEKLSRVLRGGSWNYFPRSCRAAYRRGAPAGGRDHDIGFRVCCAAPIE